MVQKKSARTPYKAGKRGPQRKGVNFAPSRRRLEALIQQLHLLAGSSAAAAKALTLVQSANARVRQAQALGSLKRPIEKPHWVRFE